MKKNRALLPDRLTPIALAVCALGLSSMAQAETAEDAAKADAEKSDKVQSVEVTARRRIETQFDVPASVTAVSGNELRKAGITEIRDVVALVPNANMTENPRGFDTYISIRGVRQADVTAEANFGTYRNGIFSGGHRVNIGSQVDLARVEVVRGPQGGLYGRDAVGGAINMVYAMPSPGDQLGGYYTLAVGNVGRTRAEGAVTAPISEDTAIRATAWTIKQTKGDLYNITRNEEIDRNSDKGARFSLASRLTSDWSFLGTLETQKADGPSLRTYAPNGVTNSITSPKETLRTVQRDDPSFRENKQNYAAGKLSYQADAGTFSLLASVRDYKMNMTVDQDHTALPPTAGMLVLRQTVDWKEAVKQKYAEALWESDAAKAFSWRAGLSYFKEEFRIGSMYYTWIDTAKLAPLRIPNIGVIGGAPGGGIPFPGSGMDVNSISGFVDFRYEFTPSVAATATFRHTRDRQSLNWSQGIADGNNPIAVALFSTSVPNFKLKAESTYTFTSPSLGLELKLTPDTNAYAIYSTAFRPGGYNTSVTNPQYLPYGQESASNYEAGIKSRFLDGRAGLNLTVFRMNQKDLTVQQDDPTDNLFNYSYLANVGRARTNGVELEAMARLTPSLGASFSLGYLDAKFTQGVINAGTPKAFDISGRVIQGARPWTINTKLDYRTPVGNATEFFGAIGARREIGGAIGNTSEYPLDAITKIDLNAGLNFSKTTQLSFYVQNATDKIITMFRFTAGDVGVNPGRRYGVQLSHQY